MNRRFTCLLAAGLLHLTAPAGTSAETLEVMLQGDSAAELRALVQAEGGELTHYLPIINAVGAELTRDQLTKALASGKVDRHIDDLALKDQPDEDISEEPTCKVAGAVEISRKADGFNWPLFNKSDDPAYLFELDIKWPAALGKLRSITLGEQAVPVAQWQGQEAQAAVIKLEKEQAPALSGRELLTVRFEHSVPAGAPLQSEYSVRAAFGDDCETKLIPGYPENSTDFYYSTVTGADVFHRQGVTGTGITVAMLDSGLWDHPALTLNTSSENRVLARYDAIADSDRNGVFDESGHGTHLTSVMAHSGRTLQGGKPTGSFKGIAPDMNIVAIKAFDVTGQGSMLDIVRGVQWTVDNAERYNIRVLNLSFAARPRWPYYLDPINQAVMRAWKAGITVIAAAGNEGPEPMTVGSPGNLPYIITVGAITDSWTIDTKADDYIPDFSSRGPTPTAHIKPDLVAPGGHITGVTRPGSSLTLDHPEYLLPGGDFVMTGSSQAAALVSGLAALLLQLDPALSPDDVKCKFLSTAEPAINRDGLLAYSPFAQGHGYVNLGRAITLGEKGCGNEQLNIEHDMAFKDHFEGPATMDAEGNISLPGLADMLSKGETEKGLSENRVWGIKAHVERLPETYRAPQNHPFFWLEMYEHERMKMEKLLKQR